MKDHLERVREEEECHKNQMSAHNQGYCYHEHKKRMKKERKLKVKQNKSNIKQKVNGPDHCIHCDKDPCVFVQKVVVVVVVVVYVKQSFLLYIWLSMNESDSE
jgi:hypothetical protein